MFKEIVDDAQRTTDDGQLEGSSQDCSKSVLENFTGEGKDNLFSSFSIF